MKLSIFFVKKCEFWWNGSHIEIVHDTEHAGRFQLRLPYVL